MLQLLLWWRRMGLMEDQIRTKLDMVQIYAIVIFLTSLSLPWILWAARLLLLMLRSVSVGISTIGCVVATGLARRESRGMKRCLATTIQ